MEKQYILNTQPQFVSNNQITQTTVLKELQNELLKCHGFSLSVAFITLQGITMILEQLKVLQENNIKGRILTSTYQLFNKPEVYERLLRFEKIEVKIYTEEIHHTKGYIFDKDNNKTIMVGSSNLTQGALKVNREWNLKLENAENTEMTHHLIQEFEEMWDKAEILNEAWIENYKRQYEQAQVLKTSFKPAKQKYTQIIPNVMQTEALKNLESLRKQGETKALLISATGTGKTYLAAFDVRNVNPKRILFIIHREQIARDALQTFQKVMPNKTMGILSGTQKDTQAEVLFTTIQTLSQDHTLNHFSPSHFDYIIYDEAHRSGAHSYLKTLNHFKPNFTLGMSATPERMDGFNIYELFDYNIAYEIRLQGALKENMLTPFHYFGVSDVSIDGQMVDEQTNIASLITTHRVDKILENIDYYGHSGKKLKGLMFCSTTQEAMLLSEKLNNQGLHAIALTGASTQHERERAIRNLSDDKHPLEYIITVDIFNEGIDIPDINQIVMLRPTQSSIIFVQQLGRGLRKSQDKDFVVVIDFIGNYKNNFMIPVALSGDRSFSQNTLRKYMMSSNAQIPGTSTIEFDQVSKEKIYESIDKGTFTQRKFLKQEYENLKYKLGRRPKLVDFLIYESLDPQVFFHQRSLDNYHKFLKVMDSEYDTSITEAMSQTLSFIAYEFSSGKRLIELYILKTLLSKPIKLKELETTFGYETTQSAINYLLLNFSVSTELKKYNQVSFIEVRDEMIRLSQTLKENLEDETFRTYFEDVLAYGMKHHELYYKDANKHNLVLGAQYTRKDVSWLLNYPTDQKGTLYGYKVDHTTKTIPLFVTYHKSTDISDSINYHDYFIDHETFNWMSRNRLTLESKEIQSILEAEKLGYTIMLFVKRNDGEEKYFFYLGDLSVIDAKDTTIEVKGKSLPIVNFVYKLKNPLRDDLYTYFTEGS